MTLIAKAVEAIPEETAHIAHLAFPKGSVVMWLRDELGSLYTDEVWSALYPSSQGQPAWSAWRLALITVMQYIEDLSDTQAAQAVRGRIDWKYALSLSLSDAGIDASVLSEFRTRLVSAGCEEQLLEPLLIRCREQGWLAAGGSARSDSTHVIGSVRALHHLELIGETLRSSLNAIAAVAPHWLQAQSEAAWFERYGNRVENSQFPKAKEKRQVIAEQMGKDGHVLLAAVFAEESPEYLRLLPAVEVLRQVWVQQFYLDADHQIHLRAQKDSPPASKRIRSPYDTAVRFGQKRDTQWVGYKVHLSETCDPEVPHLITHVETTNATLNDVNVTETIHQALDDKQLLPDTHLLDTGYVSVETILNAQQQHHVEIVAPVLPNSSWQARSNNGFDTTHFAIDWQQQQARCPAGHLSHKWRADKDRQGHEGILVTFPYAICKACDSRADCTKRQKQGRSIRLRSQVQHQYLEAARARQHTDEFKQRYHRRAGIEGTLSQGLRAFGLRRCRYIGQAKAHLQHIASAVAMNVVRCANWARGVPFAQTRCSHFMTLAPVA
ncbi:MAG: IS1182 family transposase [Cyanobacteria bacterium J06576_12]